MGRYTKLSHHVFVGKGFEVCFCLTLVKSGLQERDSGRSPTEDVCQIRPSQQEWRQACADRRLSDQAVAKEVEAFLDRLLGKQTFGEGFE
jgi:hypothetical protein